MAGLSPDLVVSVNIEYDSEPTPERVEGRTLFMSDSTDVNERSRLFQSVAELSALEKPDGTKRYPQNHPVYRACDAFFDTGEGTGREYPRGGFQVGRWYKEAEAGSIVGGATTIAVAQAALHAEGLTLYVDGLTTNIGRLSSPAPADADAVVSHIHDAIESVARYTGRVTVTGPSGSDGPYTVSSDGYIGALTGTVAEAFGWDGQAAAGSDVEPNVADAIERIEEIAPGFHPINVQAGTMTDAQILHFANWIKVRKYIAGFDVTDPAGASLVPNESTSTGAQLSALTIPRTFGLWSRRSEPKTASYLGAFAGIDRNGIDTEMNSKFVQLPGMTPDVISPAQKRELDRKNLNYFATYGVRSFVAEGISFLDNNFIDLRFFMDWAQSGLQNRLISVLADNPKVGMDPDGFALIEEQLSDFLNIGVRNGSIATGLQVSSLTRNDIRRKTEDPDFDGVLRNGYKINIGSLANLSVADRNRRKMPPIRIWMIYTDGINFADIIGQVVRGVAVAPEEVEVIPGAVAGDAAA